MTDFLKLTRGPEGPLLTQLCRLFVPHFSQRRREIGHPGGSRLSKPHQAFGRKIGHEKLFCIATNLRDGLGCEISAAHGAFHGGGPAGRSPVAGKENAWPRALRAWTVAVDSGSRREGSVHFFDHGGF